MQPSPVKTDSLPAGAQVSQGIREAADTLADQAQPTADKVKQAVNDVADRVEREAEPRAGEAADRINSQAKNLAEVRLVLQLHL